ncbi:uncharacterized protein TNCV_4111431 [Trichonephila clavipes]|nr:uncharacterized protein TNCV_4111431 [Trichonephila clavipes]
MRARNYGAHHNTRDHWMLRCMNRCSDLVVCLKRDLQCLRPEASLVLIYRPNVAGMKGRVDLAQPVKRTPDLWCGSTMHYHSILFATRGLLATDYVILNHGQVTWTTPELAPPLLTTTPHQREDVSALDRFNVHRCPTRRVFSGTGLELVTRQATIRYLYHSATAAIP